MSALVLQVQDIEQARMSGDLARATHLITVASYDHGMTPSIGHQYALTLMAQRKYQEAIDALLLLTTKFPNVAQPWVNVAQCCEILGQWDDAKQSYKAALKAHRDHPRQPDMAKAYFGLGACLFREGDNYGGEEMWRKGLRAPCTSPDAIYQRAQVRLTLGQYADGWKDWEARRQLHGFSASLETRNVRPGRHAPEWDGVSPGQVMVGGEQGAGDVIMFSRYLPVLWQVTGAEPVVYAGAEVQPWLGYAPIDRSDWSIPSGSLPIFLGILHPILPTAQEWARPQNAKPRVGVCWKGSPHHLNDKDRSSPIDFREVLQCERYEIVSLQVREGFSPRDYGDTAMFMRTLDAVVTVDTSVVHVAGTLGVPTVLIPPACPEWRWGMSRQNTTPWYPSVKIVRRKHVDAWPNAIERAKQQLIGMVC